MQPEEFSDAKAFNNQSAETHSGFSRWKAQSDSGWWHRPVSDNPYATGAAEDDSRCRNLFTCQKFYHKTRQLMIKEALESPETEMPFQKFSTFVLLRAMIKCFQSNTPAKKEPIFWKRSGQFGSSTYKGSWYHKPWNSPRWSGTVHGESQRTWKLWSRKICELPCPTPFNLTGMQVSWRDLSEATKQVRERQSQDLNERLDMPRLQTAPVQGLTPGVDAHLPDSPA